MTTMSAKFRSMAGKIILVLVLGVLLLHPFSAGEPRINISFWISNISSANDMQV